MKKSLVVIVFICFAMFLKSFAQELQEPSARSGYSLAYDENRGVMVLFGGQDTSSTRLNDTWEWRDGAWKKINVKGPSARMNAAMAYDADKKRIFLFGGRTEPGSENDLWTYDGKSWSKITTTFSPSQRQLATMVYDKRQAQFVLFGGLDAGKNPLGETWVLKDNEWTELNVPGPTPRASQCMTYNDNTEAVYIYGGYTNGAASKEFWEYKDGVWRDLTGKTGPVRIHASMTFDPDKGTILLFGGFNEDERTNELWEYANKKWSKFPIAKDNAPAPRAEHRSAFIPGKGLFVFGGVIGPETNTRNRDNDTWLYKEDAWLKLN